MTDDEGVEGRYQPTKNNLVRPTSISLHTLTTPLFRGEKSGPSVAE